jgi:tetratricopeptide (TPR) repeat protein
MGKLLNERGRYQDAVRHLTFAHKLAPDSVEIALELGTSFRLLGRYQEAIAQFEQVLTLDPDETYAAEQVEECKRKLKEIHPD